MRWRCTKDATLNTANQGSIGRHIKCKSISSKVELLQQQSPREDAMDDIERRAFIKGAGIGALAFTVGGTEVLLTPGQARAQNVAFRTLNAEQVATLEALGETLVPGLRTGGISHFIDHQV